MFPGDDMGRAMERAMFAFRNQILAGIRAIQEQEQAEQQVPRPIHHRTSVRREHGLAHQRLFEDYFADEPWWGPIVFCQRFRMLRELFLNIVETMEARDEYFQQRQDATRKIGLSLSTKCTIVSWPTALRRTYSTSIFTSGIQLSGSVWKNFVRA